MQHTHSEKEREIKRERERESEYINRGHRKESHTKCGKVERRLEWVKNLCYKAEASLKYLLNMGEIMAVNLRIISYISSLLKQKYSINCTFIIAAIWYISRISLLTTVLQHHCIIIMAIVLVPVQHYNATLSMLKSDLAQFC